MIPPGIVLDESTLALRTVFLRPGTIEIATEPTVMTTVLGSCVAICLWERHEHIGCMNHFVLPLSGLRTEKSARFGDVAIEELFARMKRLGCRAQTLDAKVFGGAAILATGGSAAGIGQQNVDMALARLGDFGARLVAQRTGGLSGRLIRFETATGMVNMRNVGGQVPANGPAGATSSERS